MPDDRDWAESDYSRLYHSVLTDPKFATVYPDDRAWATYTRLLIAADAMYPTPAPLPRSAGKYAVGVLTTAGVIVVSGGLYTIPALVKERSARYGSGKGRPRYPSDKAPTPEPDRSDAGAESESRRSKPESGRSVSESPAGGRASDSGSHSVSDFPTTETPVAQLGGDPFERVLAWLARNRLGIDPARSFGIELAKLTDRLGPDRIIEAMGQAVSEARAEGAELVDGRQVVTRVQQIVAPLYGAPRKAPTPAERERAEGLTQLEEARKARRAGA